MRPHADVSAVIPTFNRRDTISRAIDSVLAQSLHPREILVVDDGSTDGTVELLSERYGDRIRVIRQENGGVSAARRRGVKAAAGTWIAFLDSDDEWLPDKLERQWAAVAALPLDVVLVFGDLVVERGPGGSESSRSKSLFATGGLECSSPATVFDRPSEVVHPVMYPLLQSSVVRRDALIAVRAFEAGLRSSEDLLAIAQLATRGRFAAVPDAVLRLYRTPDLAGTSLSTHAGNGVDHCRARVLAFSLLARREPDGPWRTLHEEWVRGQCIALAEAGRRGAWRTSRQQFRFGVSAKAVAFTLIALSRPVLLRWGEARDARRLRVAEPEPEALEVFR